ncbi:MAG: glycoside hydrolase family 3 protein [Sulfurimonas sp.]|nr:glycoside hydrolase family 3 protein [Sulfurimonas sp.]
MKKFFILFIGIVLTLGATNTAKLPSDEKLQKMIGRMLLIGFPDETIDKNSEILRHIKKYELGGVILFDRFYNDKDKIKNISSPKQLQLLTSALKNISKKPLLISVDQEGGKVARLKSSYGFKKIPSAQKISKLNEREAKNIYKTLAQMLNDSGINTNFAPVVDLAINSKNKVIVGLERSYGNNPDKVIKYAKIFINSLKSENIFSVLKHFPGHGSSLDDSHKGFVDITNTWSKKELKPYKELIKSNDVEMIMTAHVFNSNLDKKYPATLSYNVNTKLLRGQLGYKNIIISDDLQMKAISKHYSLEQTVTLAINSGVDILLFANQLANQDIDELIKIILAQIKNGSISLDKILESNARIKQLHKKRISL